MTEVLMNPATYFTGPKPDFGEDRKIFVGGLSWDTTEDDLVQYFSQYGAISSVNIKYNALTGNPRGFGFITFTSDASIDAVLTSGPHSIKNKLIDPRKAKTRTNLKKIFVGGLDSNLTEVQIRDYFSRFGSVEGVELPFDRSRGRRREFCFIIFDSEEAADAACQESKQSIGGRECDIKRAQPQNGNQARNRGGFPGQMTQDAYGNGFPRFQNGGPTGIPTVGTTNGDWRNGSPQMRTGGIPGGFKPNGAGRMHRGRTYTGSAFSAAQPTFQAYYEEM